MSQETDGPRPGAGVRLRGLLGAATRRAGNLLGRRAAVLMYHRISDAESDPYGLCVSARDFEEHLQVVREVGRPVRLDEMVAGLRDGSLPKNAICVTFDDGYADNVDVAEPMLAQHDVPALLFVTTGPGGRAREFWWDELERVFLQPGTLPDKLELEIRGRVHTCALHGAREYSRAEYERDRAWRLLDARQPTPRHSALRKVYDLILPLAIEERTRALDAVSAWAGLDAATVRHDRRALTPEEIAQLAARATFDVGAHTVNHPSLPAQSSDAQRSEITDSKRALADWTGREVRGFAYPYGFCNESVVVATRDAGFDFACTGEFRAVTPRASRLMLPRIEAPAAGGEALRRLLHSHLQ